MDELVKEFADLWQTTGASPQAEAAMELEAKGWEEWYGTVFGWDFVDALADYHADAVSWHWNARMALRRGEDPDYLSYFPIWSREFLKSTIARRLTVCDAALSTSESLEPHKRAGFCLYVSRNRDMASKHALSIETLLASRGVRRYYPKLSQVRKNNMGGSKGWRATFFYTEAGYVYQFSGVDEGVAGGNVDDTRPTLLVPDDIDSRTDSPVITQNRFTTFTTEILPMAQKGTLVFFAQNLITRYSVMYKIHKGHVRVLTNRRPTQPIKAINNLVTATATVNGIVKDIVVSGTPTWHLFGLDRAQECIDREGLPAFLKERQHEVEQDRSGLVLQNWDDRVHVISKSEFANKFGTRDMPQSWYKDIANDWARTNTQFHVNVAGILATSAQNSVHPGLTFLFHPMSFAANTAPEDVALRILTAVAPQVLVNGAMVKWDKLMKDTLQRSGMEQYDFSLSELVDQRRKVLATVFPKYVRPVLRAQKVRRLRGSHEQSKTGALEVYQRVFGLDFVACVDEGEVLTREGWKDISQIKVGEMVYSVDGDGHLRLERVSATQCYWYSGYMVRVRKRNLYQSFTPDHQLFCQPRHAPRPHLQRWKDHTGNWLHVVRTSKSYSANGLMRPPFPLTNDRWLAFLGLFIAEGHTVSTVRDGNYRVGITQRVPDKHLKVKALMQKLPWRFYISRKEDFEICNKELWLYLRQFGKSHEKFIPRYILENATPRQLGILFKWLVFGDGHRDGTSITYVTVSPQLADDVAEIGLKLGYKVQIDQKTLPSEAHRDRFTVYFTKNILTTCVGKQPEWGDVMQEKYSGPVYDLTVENTHTFVLRQRGKVWISGNCNPGGSGGVDILNLMQTVDYSQKHLFREGEMGLSNYYVVVDDDPNSTAAIPGPPPFEESLSPDELFDGARLRYQFANCRYRDPHLTVAGEVEGEILKLHDDFLSIHMFWLHDQTGQNMPLTGDEKAEAMLAVAAPDMTLEAIFSDPTRWRHGALAAREHALAKMKRNTAKPIFSSVLAQAEWELNHPKKD